jgi:hypothetical protein
MKLDDLELATDYHLPVPTVLYRVQRIRALAGAVALGSLRLPPRGRLLNRFDLSADDVGYFAESSETAVYETLARREATMLSKSGSVALRQLLTVQTTQPLVLLDLRPHASQWPVLQSLRYASNQALAAAAQAAGYQGVLYRSAQQYGADCYAIFGAAPLRSLRLVRRAALVHNVTGALHRAVADALRGSHLPLVP